MILWFVLNKYVSVRGLGIWKKKMRPEHFSYETSQNSEYDGNFFGSIYNSLDYTMFLYIYIYMTINNAKWIYIINGSLV